MAITEKHQPWRWWRRIFQIAPSFGAQKYGGATFFEPLVQHLNAHACMKPRDAMTRKILTRESIRWCKLNQVESGVIPGSVAKAMVPSATEMHALRYEQKASSVYRKQWLAKNLA